MLSNAEKVEIAYKLLCEVVNTWDEKDVEVYQAQLSFDELVSELGKVKLK